MEFYTEREREMKMEIKRDMMREKSILIGCWLGYRTEQLKNVDIYYCSKIPSHVDDGILIPYLFERKKYFPTQSKVCSTLQCNKLLQYFISHLIELKRI